MYVENAEWELVDVKHHRRAKLYKCCEEPYLQVGFVTFIHKQYMNNMCTMKSHKGKAAWVYSTKCIYIFINNKVTRLKNLFNDLTFYLFKLTRNNFIRTEPMIKSYI